MLVTPHHQPSTGPVMVIASSLQLQLLDGVSNGFIIEGKGVVTEKNQEQITVSASRHQASNSILGLGKRKPRRTGSMLYLRSFLRSGPGLPVTGPPHHTVKKQGIFLLERGAGLGLEWTFDPVTRWPCHNSFEVTVTLLAERTRAKQQNLSLMDRVLFNRVPWLVSIPAINGR